MTRIAGPIDYARLHQPAHARALEDGRDHLRRCIAAIRAAELPRRGDAQELGRIHAELSDRLIELEQLIRRT